MITSSNSNSINSSGFNPVLQKFYEMICEIIVSQTMCGILLIFCQSSLSDDFIVKNNFREPQNLRNVNILRPTYFKKISYSVLKIISAHVSWKKIFWKKIFFPRLGAFLVTGKPLIWATFFSRENLFYIFFSTVIA